MLETVAVPADSSGLQGLLQADESFFGQGYGLFDFPAAMLVMNGQLYAGFGSFDRVFP